jgi:hypothetical protein
MYRYAASVSVARKEEYVALVASVPGASRVVSPLGFELHLPAGFEHVEYDDTPIDAVARARDERAWWEGQWFSGLADDDRNLLRSTLRRHPEKNKATPRRDPEERALFKRARALLRDLAALELDTQRAEPLGTQIGYERYETDAPRDGSIEIVRYRLLHDLSVLDFYRAAKPSAKSHWRGTRVPRLFTINGVDAVRLYVELATTPEPGREWPKFVQHYLVSGRDGWTIECGCNRDLFDDWRATLLATVASFVCAREEARRAS